MKAKDQQAAEANKNATILLKELDLEKVSRDLLLCSIRFELCINLQVVFLGAVVLHALTVCAFLSLV